MPFPVAAAMLVSSAMQAGSSMYGSYKSAKGQEEANEMQDEQFHQQMDFEERMFRNRHTYEVEDLKRAGLNPILSANSSASAPMGASPVNFQNPNASYAEGASSSGKVLNDTLQRLLSAQVDKSKAEAKSAETDAEVKAATKDAQIGAAKADATSAAVSSAKSITESEFNRSWFGKKTIQWNKTVRRLFGQD